MSTYNPTSEEIKADIERKRSEVSEKIDTIQERLSPQHLKQQAQESVQEMMRESTDKLLGYVNENVQQLPGTLMHSIKRHPVPFALIGVGLGWLLLENANTGQGESYERDTSHRYSGRDAGAYAYESPRIYSQSSYYESPYQGRERSFYQGSQEDDTGMLEQAREKLGEVSEQVRDKVQGAVQEVGHKASEMRHQVTAQTGQKASQLQSTTQHQIQHAIEANPLMVGAVAFVAGAALAMLLPNTRRENEMMGEMRDRVVNTAQQTAGEVAERLQHVAEEVTPQLQETARKVVEDVKESGKQAASEVQQTFKQSAQSAKEETARALEESTQEPGRQTTQLS